jgi:hypothetical protein
MIPPFTYLLPAREAYHIPPSTGSDSMNDCKPLVVVAVVFAVRISVSSPYPHYLSAQTKI